MRVQRLPSSSEEGISAVLLDDADQPIAVVSAFLRHLAARDYSPNTVVAYAYDLLHFWTFLRQHGLTYQDFTAARSLELLDYLRHLPSRKRVQRLGLTLWTTQAGSPTTRLSAPTLNRIFAAVSSFYDYLIISNDFFDQENPIRKEDDPASQRVSDRHRPFLGRVSRQRPVRRVVHVKTIQRAPRPLSEEQVQQVFSSLSCWRDRAMCWLMLQGGLRPGEVLNLRLEDLQYGRRRITIRHRTDHPNGVRTKSRYERVVDLYEPEALKAVSTYIMEERPQETDSPFVFLVGGQGKRRGEPLSYHALVKLFARHCEQAGIREPWITPHALRHTHATRMWEGGMRELALQKRLGHASPESTRLYTQVSDPMVVEEYQRALGQEETR